VRFVKGFGQFWWDFIVGDDWKIAATIAGVLGIGAIVAAAAPTDASWLAPLCGAALLLAFVISFVADVRRGS
jgi:hypothetical protein